MERQWGVNRSNNHQEFFRDSKDSGKEDWGRKVLETATQREWRLEGERTEHDGRRVCDDDGSRGSVGDARRGEEYELNGRHDVAAAEQCGNCTMEPTTTTDATTTSNERVGSMEWAMGWNEQLDG